MKNSSPHKIVVLGMGGTIAGLAADPHLPEHYVAAQRSVADLLSEWCPEGQEEGHEEGQEEGQEEEALGEGQRPLTWVSQQVAQIDSKDLNPAHWLALIQAVVPALQDDEVAGVVITHGTDTLEETATFLDVVLNRGEAELNKPLVLTCAMRPSNAPDADGPQNLADALLLASARETQAKGVWVVCAGQAHAARWVRKGHPQNLDAFDSGDRPVAATLLKRPDPNLAEPEQGIKRPLQRGLQRGWQSEWQWTSKPPSPTQAQTQTQTQTFIKTDRPVGFNQLAPLLRTPPEAWPRVGILTHHAGSEAWEIEALVMAGVRGIVVASTGNGTISETWRSALLKAQSEGIQLCWTTRCAQGHPTQVPEGFASIASNRLAADWGDSTPAKARVRLQLSLLLNSN